MRFIITITLGIIAAFLIAYYFTGPANPEVQFWSEVVQSRKSEIAQTRQRHPTTPIIFFTGGSSCAFSIDPKIIEEACGLPAFNLGLPVAAGAKYILHQALDQAKPGDIIIVALEPDLLTYHSTFAACTFTLRMAMRHGSLSDTVGGSTFQEKISFREFLNYSRPGPGFLVTWFAKKATHKGYRYNSNDVRYHGRIETPITDPSLVPTGKKQVTSICPSGSRLLKTFQQAASQKGVRLFYSMPWLLTAPDASVHNQAANLKILESIQPIIPTIDDGYLGVSTDPKYFADSGLHLTSAGSIVRSKAVAIPLAHYLSKQKNHHTLQAH